MVKLILYKRKIINHYVTSQDSCLMINKPKENVFETVVPRMLTLDCGFSLTHPHDRFEKAIARQIAGNRMFSRVFTLDTVRDGVADYIHIDDKFILEIAFNIQTGRLDGFDIRNYRK